MWIFCMVEQLGLDSDYLDFGTCFIRYKYVRSCIINNETEVVGKFAVQPQDPQTTTIAKLTTKPLEGPVTGKDSTSIEYTLVTSILGEIAFVTAIITSPGGGIHEKKIPLRIEALSIGL